MAAHTWVSLVLTALLLTAVVAFCAGWATHAEFQYRYRTGRRMALELESVGARRLPSREPPGHTEVHLHVHHAPAGAGPDGPLVVEGHVVRELPGTVT